MPGVQKKRRMAKFAAVHYGVIAEAVRNIEDPVLKKAMADYFASFFNSRSTTFDPAVWARWTGGQPGPNTAANTNGTKPPVPQPDVFTRSTQV
jgi:hypothetical protein